MKKSILLLDDDQELCEEYQDILEAEGFYIKIVHNGLSGKKILEKETFDLLLLDIKIPGLTGFEILKWLKDSNYKIKIIVLTGRPLYQNEYLKDNTEEELLNYADDIINKPSNIENIIKRINGLL